MKEFCILVMALVGPTDHPVIRYHCECIDLMRVQTSSGTENCWVNFWSTDDSIWYHDPKTGRPLRELVLNGYVRWIPDHGRPHPCGDFWEYKFVRSGTIHIVTAPEFNENFTNWDYEQGFQRMGGRNQRWW